MSEERATASPPPVVGEGQGGGNPKPRRSGVPPPLAPPHVMSKPCLRHEGRAIRSNLSIYHVAALAGAAGGVVAAQREHVERAGVAGSAVLVGPAPRVDQALGPLQVGAAPAGRPVRTLHQRLEADLR